jgi:benzil reductase ((S)-benzoin forming)
MWLFIEKLIKISPLKKTVIITGTNRGLGKAIVDELIKDMDYQIISLSRSITEDQKKYSSNFFRFIKIDLSKDKLDEKIKEFNDLIGSESICFINNASIIEPIKKIGEIDEGEIDKIISVNIKSTIMVTKFLLKNFESNPLTFVNISSGAANRAISNWSLYCSTKVFNQMFFNAAQCEYQQHRFLNIDPGVMDTGMQEILRKSDFPDVENFKKFLSEGKLKSPNDVAKELIQTINNPA